MVRPRDCSTCGHNQVEEDGTYFCHILDWGGISDKEYAALVDYIENHPNGDCPQYSYDMISD